MPILCTSGDVVAGIVEELQLGLTVPPGDVDAVAQAFRDLVADPALLERARGRLETAAPAYEWQHAVKPLARWLESPVRRSDHVAVEGLRAVDAQQRRREDLERYANELKMLVPTPCSAARAGSGQARSPERRPYRSAGALTCVADGMQ